jgi:DNA-binding protein HU-beta
MQCSGLVAEAAKAGQAVVLSGFGQFKVQDRAAREGRNPATGEPIEIAASRKLAFTAAKPLRDRLSPRSAQSCGPRMKGIVR